MAARIWDRGTIVQEGDVFARRYRIVARIAAGGMGVVFEAYDEQVGRPVALKVMTVSSLHDPTAPARFKREAQALASIDNPGVITVHDYGEHEGHLFLVMALVRGGDIASRLSDHRHLSPERTLQIAQGVAHALDDVHAQGLVLCDIKPSTRAAQGPGRAARPVRLRLAKASDGSDKLTATGQAPGTGGVLVPRAAAGREGHRRVRHLRVRVPALPLPDRKAAVHRRRRARRRLRAPRAAGARRAALNPQLPPQAQAVLARCLDKAHGQRWRTGRDVAGGMHQALSAPTVIELDPPRTRVASQS